MSEPQEIPPNIAAMRRYNWLRLYTVLPRNPKIAKATDAVFRAYIYALCSTREEQVRGEWISRDYLAAAIGKYARHIPAMLDLELLVEDGDGTLRVPQYDHWQPSDETSARRSHDYRERLKTERANTHGLDPSNRSVTRDDTEARQPSAQRRGRGLGEAEAETEAEPEARFASGRFSTVAHAASAAPAPSLTRQDEWTPTRCSRPRCGVVIDDFDDAYVGDGPDAIVHLGECP